MVKLLQATSEWKAGKWKRKSSTRWYNNWRIL